MSARYAQESGKTEKGKSLFFNVGGTAEICIFAPGQQALFWGFFSAKTSFRKSVPEMGDCQRKYAKRKKERERAT